MRILILTNDSLVKPNGGMGVVVSNLKALASDGLKIDVVGVSTCLEDSVHISNDNWSWTPISLLPMRFGSEPDLITTILNQGSYIAKSMTLPKPDVIHALDFGTAIAAETLSNQLNVPWIFSIQLSTTYMFKDMGFNLINTDLGKIGDSIEQKAVQTCNALVSVSADYAHMFPKMSGSSFVINNGINLKDFDNVSTVNLPGNRPIKVLYVGRFDLMKNVLSILDAKVPDNVDIIFAGGTNAGIFQIYEAMRHKCDSSDQHHYIGYTSGKDKFNLLHSVDAVLFPSVHEPFGIVGLEALASKSILLASNVNGMKDYLTPENHINCGITPESISNALQKLSIMSEKDKTDIINVGYETALRFDWSSILPIYKAVYEKMLISC